jgi:hypothetical protein
MGFTTSVGFELQTLHLSFLYVGISFMALDKTELAAALPVDRPCMQEFNVLLSSVHIASEHAYGHLKGHFLSLKGMGEHKDIQTLYKAIKAILVLHNICIDWNDHPESISQYDPTDIWLGWDGVEVEVDGVEDDEDVVDVGVDIIMGEPAIPV